MTTGTRTPHSRAGAGRVALRARNLFGEVELRNLLVDHGIRVTDQRLLLLRELTRLIRPVSHPELTQRLAETTLDRATIYRNLCSLTKAGLLVRRLAGGSVWRYELPRGSSSEHGSHPHFVCTDWGSIACLSADDVTLHGIATRGEIVEVELRGRCGACGPRDSK